MTVDKFVQAADHASKMGHQLFSPFNCNYLSRGSQGGVLNPYFFAMYLELSDHLGSAQSGKYGCGSPNVCW